jgi:Mg/Co/Ni transporter MgtE
MRRTRLISLPVLDMGNKTVRRLDINNIITVFAEAKASRKKF